MNDLEYRDRLLQILAVFSSVEIQQRIYRKEIHGVHDLDDLLDLWDWGPRYDTKALETLFTKQELKYLCDFHDALWDYYCNVFEKLGEDEQAFMYVADKPYHEGWLEVVKCARQTLEKFPDFDFEGWRKEGFPLRGFTI